MQISSIKIYDLTPFTALDFPDTLAAILWFGGCNMRCPYCHNSDIVFGKNEKDFSEVVDFLTKRKAILEGVSLCGGEPTIHKDIIQICKIIKTLGYKIKLDTNGAKPDIVQELLDKNLLDYVALDFKAPKHKFKTITKLDAYEKLLQTLQILNKSDIVFEVRTTVHTELLDESDIIEISKVLFDSNFRGEYFIQNFTDGGKTLSNLPAQTKPLNIKNLKLLVKFNSRNFA